MSQGAVVSRAARGASARLGPLHPWIEIEQDGQRRFVQPEESRAVGLGGDDFVRLCAFAPLGPGQPPTDAAPTVSLYLELTGETIDASLIGETLLV